MFGEKTKSRRYAGNERTLHIDVRRIVLYSRDLAGVDCKTRGMTSDVAAFELNLCSLRHI